ncbi:hypothetical protein [Ancylobacter radicis]|uniref:DUF883 domain-containing protein n=1 Tax=Ancylobacter radicis TaxID=2836179 RepID=A0ABS5RC76_9HYPH|nr:hypothetical protein [Ancylobacter radicis]MBS9478910.1 hypothetical protein [Ancylobacter radicis]
MSMNDDLPSKADSLASAARNETEALSDKVNEAIETAQNFAGDVGERGKSAYRSGNAAVAAYVDPLPGMVLAAAAGFLAGCLWSSGKRY